MLKIAFIAIKIVVCVFDNSFCPVKDKGNGIACQNQSQSSYAKSPERREPTQQSNKNRQTMPSLRKYQQMGDEVVLDMCIKAGLVVYMPTDLISSSVNKRLRGYINRKLQNMYADIYFCGCTNDIRKRMILKKYIKDTVKEIQKIRDDIPSESQKNQSYEYDGMAYILDMQDWRRFETHQLYMDIDKVLERLNHLLMGQDLQCMIRNIEMYKLKFGLIYKV